jgi:hypothetical protein
MMTPEEIGRLLQERDDLERRGASWHSSGGLFLYLAGVFGFLGVVSVFFNSEVLGSVGGPLCIVIAVASYAFYRSKEHESSANFARMRAIDRIVKRERELAAGRP